MTILDDITDIENKYKSVIDSLREMDRKHFTTSVAEMNLYRDGNSPIFLTPTLMTSDKMDRCIAQHHQI